MVTGSTCDPGTDICLRVGGLIIADYAYNAQGNGANQPIYTGAGASFDRTTSHWDTKMRADVIMDTRMQTAYGTLRTFTLMHFNNGSVADTTNLARAFIQFAGFTFGRTVSFSDVPGSFAPSSGAIGVVQTQFASDTSANGVNQIAYTWELGNGVTLTAGSDERRVKSLSNLSTAGTWTIDSDPTTSRAGNFIPDEYLAFKVNQAWGQFGVSAIAHQNAAQYYSSGAGVTGYAPSAPCVAQPATTFCTHPNDAWGGAVLAGMQLNTPWGNGNQDHFDLSGLASRGAGGYGASNNTASPGIFGGGNQIAIGAMTDGVYINGSSIQLTTSWTVGVAYEHWFTPTFKITPFAAYQKNSYNNTVIAGRWFCGGGGTGTGALGVQNIVVSAATACDPSYGLWTAGAHADWYPVKQLRFLLESEWTGVQTAMNGQVVTLTKAVGARPTGAYSVKNQGVLSAFFRAQKDF